MNASITTLHSLMNPELLHSHFDLAKQVFSDSSRRYEFYCGTLSSEITRFHLLETLEQSILLLDEVLNGYIPEKERIANPLPANTYFSCVLYADRVHIFDELTDDTVGETIPISTYAALLKSLFHELSKDRFYENGQLVYQDSYENGLRHGVWTGWYANGGIEFSGQYRHGKRVGRWEYYHANCKRWRVQELNEQGMLHGEQCSWWENGALLSREYYENGLLEGERVMYYENGQIMNSRKYKLGGILDGIYEHFHSDGTVDFSVEYRDGVDLRTIHGDRRN